MRQRFQGQFLIQMRLDIGRTALDLLGVRRVIALPVHTPDEILIHGVVDGAHVGDGPALGQALDITVAHRVGGIRCKAPFNGRPGAERGEVAGRQDGALHGIACGDPNAAGNLAGLFHGAAIVHIAVPDQLQQRLLSLVGAMAVAARRAGFPFARFFLMLKAQVAAAELFTGNDAMQHDGILKKQDGRDCGNALHGPDKSRTPVRVDMIAPDRVGQQLVADLVVKHRADHMTPEQLVLLPLVHDGPEDAQRRAEDQRRAFGGALMDHIGQAACVLKDPVIDVLRAVRCRQGAVGGVAPGVHRGAAQQRIRERIRFSETESMLIHSGHAPLLSSS